MPYGDINLGYIGSGTGLLHDKASHYMSQCWQLISRVLWYSPDSNFEVSAQDILWVISLEFIFLKLQPHLTGASELIIN